MNRATLREILLTGVNVAMSPTLAMGANTALRDGGELRHTIATLREAATAYQARKLSYAMPLVQESRRIGQR